MRNPLLIPSAVLLLGACTTAPRTDPLPLLQLSSWRPPAPQHCTVEQPSVAVEPSMVVDAGRLAAATGGLAAGSSILSIGTDSTGAVSRLRMVESSLPQDEHARLRAAVHSSLVPSALPADWDARLRVDTRAGEAPGVAIGAYEECPPVLLDRQVMGEVVSRLARLVPPRSQSYAEIRAHVDEDGRVMEVRVKGSSFGIAAEQELPQVAQQMRFLPAVVDRQPVAAWVALPVRLRNVR